jgi:processing peptidase subunit beta
MLCPVRSGPRSVIPTTTIHLCFLTNLPVRLPFFHSPPPPLSLQPPHTKHTTNTQPHLNTNYHPPPSVKFNSEDVAYMAVAFPTASWTSEYAFPLMLMQLLLGSYDRASGMGANYASNLCQDVAENELCYSLNTFNTHYKDTGLFGVYAVCPDNKVDDCSWYIMNNLIRLVHSVGDDEVERAKVSLKAAMLMNLDGHNNVAEEIGRSLLNYGRRMTPAEVFSRIDTITTSDIKATAYKFFNDQDHSLAAVGGIHELPDYTWFRRHSYWLRY